jgi:hypothetical protein|tara:strand:+ start:877 stop:1047 length:171 start_codon:yes stop_codon:yes gene_type:complete
MALGNQLINDKLMKQFNREVNAAKKQIKEIESLIKSVSVYTPKTRPRTAKKKTTKK